MSDYLGWREKKAPAEYRTKFDREIIPGGPMTHSYEDYVKDIFRANRPPPPEPPKPTLNVTQNQNASDYKESFEAGYGIAPLTSERPPDYSVPLNEDKFFKPGPGGIPSYTPHQISASKMLQMEQEYGKDAIDDSNDASFVDKSPLEKFAPLSPYMYLDHPYTRRQDSRIVGSNFVQLTTRPRDSFLEKIDKTLAEVRALPRY
ncbi:hypothetical protein FO519_004378 [Halicephalobus sp. NKZ332]|nr:hypothetical protein FO519_004378 [Halicephalobus sp. NKZ332]